ncbi:hypothetical protein QQM39_02845 [Streptomyces sp. DT2A-34]|uniref:hypothetical protein n=1 Tax=Streptomyces sp. DT2A-34 TaxID=3051182 RepID=UPI00265C8911|nr:hypothetical protein [Streptomyces sp. DT2A-34]MDO0909835.1 hypothetical protein [Streptomyces sp. DT2A-34]
MSVSHHTPSQAEGEREDADIPRADHPTPEYTTPSQAEGERDDATGTTTDTERLGGRDRRE